MKKFLKYIAIMIFGFVILIACRDEETIRIPELTEAANVRIQLDPDYSSLRADDLDNAKLVFSVFSDNTNIQEVVLSAEYYNFAQDSSYSRMVIKTYKQSDFDAASGAIRDVTFTAADLADMFGVGNATDLGGGDRFDFYNVTTLTNGMVFPDTVSLPTGEFLNTTPNIVNSAATTSFSVGFTAYVACPISSSYGTGDYMLEQIAGPDDPFFGNPYRWTPEMVNITAVSPIERHFEGTYFTFTDRSFNFLLICGNVLVGATGGGAGCSGTLTWKSATPPGQYDPNDDSVIIIELLDNITGDCDLTPSEPLTLKLTKVQ